MRFTAIFLSIFVIAFLLSCKDSSNSVKPNLTKSNTIEFDSLLAQKLGADEYGVNQYVMAFLKLGPKRDQDSVTAPNYNERI